VTAYGSGVDTAPVQRALVAWRLGAVASTVLALGSGAHVLGGGHAPSPGAAALVGALVLLGAAALASRPLTVRVLLPGALGGQLAVHAALTWLGPGGVAGADPTGHHGTVPVPGAAPAAEVAAHPAADLMLVAHAVAMVATVLLLVAVERGVAGLARRWSTVLPALLGGVAVVGRAPGRPLPGALRRPRGVLVLAGGAVRRGPPVRPRPRTA
jgi:hypothetical protein